MWPFSRKKEPLPADRVDGYLPAPLPVEDPWQAPNVVAQIEARGRSSRTDAVALDGWKNELTGIGDFMRDKTLGGRPQGLEFLVHLVPNVVAEARWRGDPVGKRIVETIPDEMSREGWDLTVQPTEEDETSAKEKVDKVWREEYRRAYDAAEAAGTLPPGITPPQAAQPPQPPPVGALDVDDEGQEIAEAMEGKCEELGVDAAFWQALCYEQGYGGSAILIGADDGMADLTKPLDEKRIKSVDWLNVFSGGWDGEVVAWSYYNDPSKPNYGKPEMYMMRNLGVPLARIPAPGGKITNPDILPQNSISLGYGGTVWWVHESRLLVFPGTTASPRARVQMRGWGDSVFTRVDEVLQQYGQTWGGIANLMTDFSQAILSIKGLAQSIAANKGVVSSRALQANISRSIARILLIDSEEEFKRDTVSLAGVADVLNAFALRIAAASGMPLSLLMGQVQGGLGDAAAGDIRYFYDRVASWQKRRMLPQLRRLLKLIFLSKQGPTDGAEPERWSVAMRPLYQMSALEKADVRLKTTQADEICINSGQVTAEEVAVTRYAGSDFNDGPIQLDLDGRAEMASSYEESQTAAAAAPGSDGGAPASDSKIVITPSMQGGIVKVNEARAKMGLPPWEGPDGDLSINEFMAKHSGAAAQAANAEKGVVGDPQSVEEQAAAKAEQARAAFGHKPGAPGEKPEGKPGETPPPGAAKEGATEETAPSKKELPPPTKKLVE
jgi:hypothetical protein